MVAIPVTVRNFAPISSPMIAPPKYKSFPTYRSSPVVTIPVSVVRPATDRSPVTVKKPTVATPI